MGRRHVKEFRPDEALNLISADREGRPLRCPACGGEGVHRTPPRNDDGASTPGRVLLGCGGCGRVVSYIDRAENPTTAH